MRGLMTAATAALFAAGCAVSQPYDGVPRDRPAAGGDRAGAPSSGGHARADWGLEAYIVPPEHGGLRFQVNRPAYVAMFEIVPNGGTRLIYPTPSMGRMDGFVFSGDRVASGSYFRGDDWLGGGLYSHSAEMSRPRFLFLIASERPLDIDAFGRYGAGMRSVLGHHYWASTDPYLTMERLAEVALPTRADDGTWTTDLYVYWPQALRQYRASRDVLIRCNGYTTFVAYEYAYEARRYLCGWTGDQVAVNPRRPRPPTPPTPPVTGEDSTEIEQPGRRAPLPPAEEAGPRRLGSSRQLQQPQTRRPDEHRVVGEAITVGDGAEEESQAEPAEGSARRPRPDDAPAAEPGSAPRSPVPTAGGSAGEPAAREPRSVTPGAVDPSPRTERPSVAEPVTRPGAVGHEQPVDRARPSEPQSARPAPTPRAVRPAAEPPSGGTAAPRSVRPASPSPAAGNQPRAQPPTASPTRAAPAPRSTPRARPSPPPAPARETGEAPAKRGGGGGGEDGKDGGGLASVA